MAEGRWSLSIICHGHAEAITTQLKTLSALPSLKDAELILTMNLPGESRPDVSGWPGTVLWVENQVPKSFAANHNAAVAVARHAQAALLDPDLTWINDPFTLLEELLADPTVGLAAACVIDEFGKLADHARPVPTPASVLTRRFLGVDDGLPAPKEMHEVPWLAGLFLAFRSSYWKTLGGFDERYRLYAEDVEISLRCWTRGARVVRHPLIAVSHQARRESRTKLQRLLWHLRGLIRLWCSPTWKAYRRGRWMRG